MINYYRRLEEKVIGFRTLFKHNKLRKLFKNDKDKNIELLSKVVLAVQELPIGLCISDESGVILWSNDSLDQYLGTSLDTNNNIFKLLKLGDTIQLAKSNQLSTLELASDKHMEYSVSKLSDSNYYLIYVKDISDRVFLENSRKIFYGNISHELRIPLTVLKGYIEILESERRQYKYEKSDLKPYKNMQAQVDRLLNMVDKLLTLTKIESNPFFHNKSLVDMPDIIYSIYDEVQVRNANKQKISLYLDDELFVKGHEQPLREAVSNLIYNAIEHNPKNTKIDIHWEKVKKDSNGYALFSIKDNGIGISKEHLNRLTERFYVVSSARNRNISKNVGSGLGLAIVKNSLKMHNSELILESAKNKGSCFKFYLPIYAEENEDLNAK